MMGPNTALRAARSLQSSLWASCRPPPLAAVRAFSLSHSTRAQDGFAGMGNPNKTMDDTLTNVTASFARTSGAAAYNSLIPDRSDAAGAIKDLSQEWEPEDRHHLHVYATKHNTHITLSKPNRDSLISVSCGNIGFRKAGRGSYDAAYQLAAFVMNRIQDKGLLPQIEKIELVYRGFGAGREAVTKAILGSEGKKIRPLIVKLSDSTRLKFGGVRSKKPRRLG